MGLETTTTIAGLVPTNPLDADMISSGDDHLRLIKAVLKATFPGVGGAGFATPITVFEAQLNKLAPFVDNIAALRAQPKLGQKVVATLGYWAIRDGGHGVYWLDSADTTSVDDGGTIIVATDGGRWKLVHDYVVDVAQFGACTNTDDLVYVTNALTWADSVLTIGTVPSITLTSYQQLRTSNTILHPGNAELHLHFFGGLTTAASWVGLDSDPIIDISGASTNHILGDVDCNNVCNGVTYSGYRLNLSKTSVYHGKYWQVSGGGECQLTVNVNQWLKTDPEFLDKANFTAYGFYVTGADTLFLDCSAALCLYPVYLATSSAANAFLNCHFWQGTGGGPGPIPVDPVVVYNESNAYNYMYNCYFDNGYVIMKKGGLYIYGGQYTDNGLSTISQPYIRYFCAANGISPVTAIVQGIKASVGFYDDGANIYPGDFTAINATTVDISKGDYVNVSRFEYNICPNEGTSPVRTHLKPIDNWVDTFKIGAGSTLKTTYSTDTIEFEAPTVRVVSGAGVPHVIKLGAGNVGLAEDVASNLTFSNGTGYMWRIKSGATGAMVPMTDVTSDIGENTKRVRYVFAQQLRLTPTTSESLPHNLTIGFEWVDDTHFKIKQRGSDGVTRSVTLTTA